MDTLVFRANLFAERENNKVEIGFLNGLKFKLNGEFIEVNNQILGDSKSFSEFVNNIKSLTGWNCFTGFDFTYRYVNKDNNIDVTLTCKDFVIRFNESDDVSTDGAEFYFNPNFPSVNGALHTEMKAFMYDDYYLNGFDGNGGIGGGESGDATDEGWNDGFDSDNEYTEDNEYGCSDYEIWRGHDNWINAFDYIKNQLFKYNYNNQEHLHILKMKYWALDGDLMDEEKEAGLTDNDVNHPLNHNAVLQNELTFLDKYIRTKDKKLDKYEVNFSSLVRNRKTQLRSFLKQKDPETNKRYEAWQQDYSSRPTSLTTGQFDSLYNLYKVKEKAGELSDAFEITSKLADSYIDFKKVIQEIAIANSKSPAEMDEDIRKSAREEKQKEDVHFVKEMRRAHEEIIDLVKSVKPDEPSADDLGFPSFDDETGGSSVEIDGEIVICNFPTIRVDVSEIKNDSSHKGAIIEELGEGGYRFKTKYGDDLITDFELPAPDLRKYKNSVKPFFDGEVEWNFDNWLYAYYFVATINSSSSSGGSNAPQYEETDLSEEEAKAESEKNQEEVKKQQEAENALINSSSLKIIAYRGDVIDGVAKKNPSKNTICIGVSNLPKNNENVIFMFWTDNKTIDQYGNILDKSSWSGSLPLFAGGFQMSGCIGTTVLVSAPNSCTKVGCKTISGSELAIATINRISGSSTRSLNESQISLYSSDGDSSEPVYYLKPLGVDKDSFNAKQRARFDELNRRWVNFNELRERQIANTGTRVQLESMFDAESIDVRPDLKKTLCERKKEKKNVTNILKEICLYNEFK